MVKPSPAFARLPRPFYLCDIDAAIGRLREIEAAYRASFPRLTVACSYKTNYLPTLLGALHRAGAIAEVVSVMEYRLAIRLGVPPSDIVFNGTGRGQSELGLGLGDGALVMLESQDEVGAALAWAGQHPGAVARVGLRVALPVHDGPGQGTHSRFGLTPDDGQLSAAADRIDTCPGLRLCAIHAHCSSKARTSEVFASTGAVLAAAIRRLGPERIEIVDLGGGLGFAHPAMSMSFPSFHEVAATLRRSLERGGVDPGAHRFVVEPGIAMVGDSTAYVADVLAVKHRPERTIAVISGGVHTLKPTKHRHWLPTVALDSQLRPKAGPEEPWDIVGHTCMEEDTVAAGQPLPTLQRGDVLWFENVGAYCMVFTPPFIHPGPPVYCVLDGEVVQARRAESFEDVFATYRIESHGSADL
jgi:diaminopimelate decarboxylase